MVKHIVLFQLKEGMDPQEKRLVMDTFRTGILALPSVMPFIQHVEVEFNINPQEKYDIALYSEFATFEDMKAYAVHPDHLAVAGLLKPHVANRACTDYETK